ncbi:hypothetical protein CBR_g24128 [Chara braunii]|uniref:Uncharacterized protein n=1 Tax=Chara braunii TaxID=69332 RepID=A0A388L616_CHABU|nr:hypothetical protein CBR_g24128 [Chara braunii]|eukprot:GBG77682.1 hypothetical protein CBR_g24128 [Chara braunii]
MRQRARGKERATKSTRRRERGGRSVFRSYIMDVLVVVEWTRMLVYSVRRNGGGRERWELEAWRIWWSRACRAGSSVQEFCS